MPRKFFKKLQHDYITQENGSQTSIYFDNKSPQKPLAILIHGFTGNAFGLSFLAKEMAEDFRIILVEMPNHGKSSLQKIENSQDLQNWNAEITSKLEQKFGRISLIIYHSMSCFSSNSKIASKMPTIFINPVFKTPQKYIRSIKISANPIVALISNLPPAPLIKALLLIKSWSFQSLKNVLKNTLFSLSTPSQIIFQTKMTKIPFEKPLLSDNSKHVKMIVVGTKDSLSSPLSDKDRNKFFSKAKIIEINTGHLSPIERPKEIANYLIKK